MSKHIEAIRMGWNGEHLARYLLSKISFVSGTINTGDDTGVDFICTRFRVKKEISKENSQEYTFHIPQNAFAVQIKKTDDRKFEISKHAEEYYCNLEIPFFWGIINETDKSLTLYSGEYLVSFISLNGGTKKDQKLLNGEIKDQRLFIELVDGRDENIEKELKPFKETSKKVEVKFPYVMKMKIDFDYYKEFSSVTILDECCKIMQNNIATKMKDSFMFDIFGKNAKKVYIGPTSKLYCEKNLYLALAEVYYNLQNLDFSEDKEKIYDNFLESMLKIDKDIARELVDAVNKFRNRKSPK